MGVRIFRDDNWHRITNGVISRKDIMRLDREKDRELIGYLAAHAPEPCIVIDNQDTSLHVYNHLMHPVYAKTVQKMARS